MKRILVYFLPNKILNGGKNNSNINIDSTIRCEACNYTGKPHNKTPFYIKWRSFHIKLPWKDNLLKAITNLDDKYNYYDRIPHYYCPKCSYEMSNENLDISDDNIKTIRKRNKKIVLDSLFLLFTIIVTIIIILFLFNNF